MDQQTLEVYERRAPELCARYRSARPQRFRALALGFFHPGAPTADIGSGSGRDLVWLRERGFPVVGYDASEAMRREAILTYPDLDIRLSALPDLPGVADASFANVLCSAVLMHLPQTQLATAISNLARILEPGGRLLLSFRASTSSDEREPDGRLFTPIHPGRFTLTLEAAGLRVVMRETYDGALRPGVTWNAVLAEKASTATKRGLDRVQAVLAQDAKSATYKLVLIRALCLIGRTHQHLVTWGPEEVFVPLQALAIAWLRFYWPLFTSPTFIAQLRGEHPDSAKQIAFRRSIEGLAREVGASGLYALLASLDEQPERHDQALKVIAHAIRVGPVRYSGTSGPPLFRHVPSVPSGVAAEHLDPFGWVAVPEAVWLDLVRFDHWIEDSVVLQWAQLTAEMNPSLTVAEVLPLVLATPDAARETGEMRAVLLSQRVWDTLECVWTGVRLSDAFQIDHLLPYSVWGNNDLWNLLPADPTVNLGKRAALPSQDLLLARRDCIARYWRLYSERWGKRFAGQVGRSLGGVVGESGWEEVAFAGLLESVDRMARTRGLPRWEP